MKKILNIHLISSLGLGLISNNAKKVLWYLAKNAFLFTLIFILLSIIFAEILFFAYIILTNKEPVSASVPIKFQKDIYDDVFKKWQERNNIFENSSKENYPNPFK